MECQQVQKVAIYEQTFNVRQLCILAKSSEKINFTALKHQYYDLFIKPVADIF